MKQDWSAALVLKCDDRWIDTCTVGDMREPITTLLFRIINT